MTKDPTHIALEEYVQFSTKGLWELHRVLVASSDPKQEAVFAEICRRREARA